MACNQRRRRSIGLCAFTPALLSATAPSDNSFVDIFADVPARVRDDAVAGRLEGDALSDIFQRSLSRHLYVGLPSGTFRLGKALILRNGQRIRLSPGTLVRQDTVGGNAFVATAATGVEIDLNGGVIRGPGGWSATWTGNQGPDGFRGLVCTGCTGFKVRGPGRVINWGNAAIAIVGGHNYSITDVTVEGTHRHGQPLTTGSNFQNGIYVANDARWGPADGGRIVRVEVSGTAQGILRESLPGAPPPITMSIIDRPYIHDIPGQHAIYNMDGEMQVIGGRYENLAYSAVKFQAAEANRDVYRFTATGVVAHHIGGSMFEIAALGLGSLNQVRLQGSGRDVGYLLSLHGKTRDFSANVTGTRMTGHAVYVLGSDIRRTAIRVDASDIDQDGILVVADNAEIDLTPRINNANRRRVPEDSGLRVTSHSALVTLHNPDIRDAFGNMTHGIFNQYDGSQIRIVGTLTATGAKETAIRADGEIIGLPAAARLGGAKGKFSGQYRVRTAP